MRHLVRHGLIGAILALLAGCAALPPPSAPAPTPRPAPSARPPEGAAPPPAAATPSTRSAARRYAAQARRPLNVHTSCRFSDESGYNGRLALRVEADEVRDLDAEVNIPKRGSCRFALGEFRQNGKRPGVELDGTRDGCKVRMWAQGERVSVAFTNCAARCSGSSFDYLWPILVDTRTGGCS